MGGSHERECRRHRTAAAVLDHKDGELRVSLARMKVPEPKDDEGGVDATPLNPSDIGLLFALASRRPDAHDAVPCAEVSRSFSPGGPDYRLS